MLQRERVAELRRKLPPGPIVDDYEFGERPRDLSSDGPIITRTLSELCGERPLVLYHFMFGKSTTEPCPLCSLWADGWNGLSGLLEENIDFALVAAAPI